MDDAWDATARGDGITIDGHGLGRGEEGDHIGNLLGRDDFSDEVAASHAGLDLPLRDSLGLGLRGDHARRFFGAGQARVHTNDRIPCAPSSSAMFLVNAATETLRIEPMMVPVERAASPLTWMMRPERALIMCGATSRAVRRYPITLMFISAQKCSLLISLSCGGLPCPPGWAAQLTRMSMRPKAETTLPTMLRTAASSPLSQLKASTFTPVAAAISARAASRVARSRATMATLAPSFASAKATALPIPRLPPVTIAALPLSSRSMCAPPVRF